MPGAIWQILFWHIDKKLFLFTRWLSSRTSGSRSAVQSLTKSVRPSKPSSCELHAFFYFEGFALWDKMLLTSHLLKKNQRKQFSDFGPKNPLRIMRYQKHCKTTMYPYIPDCLASDFYNLWFFTVSVDFRQPIAVSDISIYICLIDIRSIQKQIQRTTEWEASRFV